MGTDCFLRSVPIFSSLFLSPSLSLFLSLTLSSSQLLSSGIEVVSFVLQPGAAVQAVTAAIDGDDLAVVGAEIDYSVKKYSTTRLRQSRHISNSSVISTYDFK